MLVTVNNAHLFHNIVISSTDVLDYLPTSDMPVLASRALSTLP